MSFKDDETSDSSLTNVPSRENVTAFMHSIYDFEIRKAAKPSQANLHATQHY